MHYPVSLPSIKKEKIVDHKNDFLNDKNSHFFITNSIQSISKYRFNLTFKSQAFNFINLFRIFRSKELCDNHPSNFDISDILILYLISNHVLDRRFLPIKNQYFI